MFVLSPAEQESRWQAEFCLPPALPRFLSQLIFSTLKIEAICASETSTDTQRTTRRYILEDGTLLKNVLRKNM
jgi:hypothetical protein